MSDISTWDRTIDFLTLSGATTGALLVAATLVYLAVRFLVLAPPTIVETIYRPRSTSRGRHTPAAIRANGGEPLRIAT